MPCSRLRRRMAQTWAKRTWCRRPKTAAVRKTRSIRARSGAAPPDGLGARPVGGLALFLLQRLNQRLAELLEVLWLSAGDPVLIDHHRLVQHLGAGLLQVVLHRLPRGQGAALHQAGREQELRSVAHRRDATLER